MRVSVNEVRQLELGAYYSIVGTRHGFPLPPQVLYLQEREIHPTLTGVGHVKGILFWRMWDQIGIEKDHLITLHEINVPEHGDHDVHLERIPEETVSRAVKQAAFRDVQEEIAQRLGKHFVN